MKLVILDRDGVINYDSDEYIKSPDEWIPIPGSIEAIARLKRADYHVVVATNQSGIARGLYDMDMLNRINGKMMQAVQQRGAEIDGIFLCPHGPDDGCNCRKPRPGLFHEIGDRFKVNLNGAWAVGDSERDLIAARDALASPVLVRTGKGVRTLKSSPYAEEVPVFDDLAAFTDALLDGQLPAA